MPTCPTCSGTIIEYSASAGNGFCVSCGTVVEENTIVNEITFGETGSGAAMVQGSYVGQGARGARMGGPFGNRGNMESREQTMMNANKKIRQIATVLRLPETTCQKAARYYELAVETKFTKGRKSIYVVASCLYVVSREAKSGVMLIDFSDLLQVNVFVLGSTYLALLSSLSLHSSIAPIDPSIYIPRFASLLEFGPETQQVSMDAIRICSRFNRDWLVIGRRPSGICGAALYIAARMNNFRRSVSEIIQVVKIGDATLRKRLVEFGKTTSAELSVESFRGVWIEEEGVPPAFEKGREKEERERLKAIALAAEAAEQETEKSTKKKKGRKRKRNEVADAEQEQEQPQETLPQPEIDPQLTQSDHIPIDPALLDPGILTGTTLIEPSQSQPTLSDSLDSTNRPPTSANEPALFLASDDEEDPSPLPRSQSQILKNTDLGVAEQALPMPSDYEKALDKRLEEEIGGFVGDMEGLVEEVETAARPAIGSSVGDDIPDMEQNGSGAEEGGGGAPVPEPPPPPLNPEQETNNENEDTGDQSSEEAELIGTFPESVEKELDAFILTPEQVAIKERVWVELNRDYLVQIALKAEREAREEREGGGTSTKARKKRKAAQKPRDASTPAGNTASESVRSMVKKGSKFSKRINYDAIESLFGSGASKDADGLEDGGKLYTFDKDRDSSVDAEGIRRKEYPYDERHEHDDDMDGEGEIIIEEDGSGGVGFGKAKKDRDRSRSRGAISERTDDVTEYDGEGEGDETMADDDMASHRGDTSYGDYNYDDAYEQEV